MPCRQVATLRGSRTPAVIFRNARLRVVRNIRLPGHRAPLPDALVLGCYALDACTG
jgi:hypothetical protein